MSDRGFSTSEAARALGLSAERVRQLAKTGVLPCQQTALGRLYDRAAVEALAARRRQRAPAVSRTAASDP